MKPFVYAGGVALLTGAASGIGRALARALAARGCHLALVDRDETALRDVAVQVEAHGVRVSAHTFDLASGELASLVEEVLSEHGRVTLLINNAGVSLTGRFEEVSTAEFEWLMDTNLRAVIALTKLCLPHLLQAEGAHVVNLSSVFGFIAPPGQTAYAASKFAVRGFSEALRHELSGRVGVSVVHPGGVKTNIALAARVAALTDREAAARSAQRFTARVTTTPEDAAATILRAVQRRQSRVLIGADAHLIDIMQRLLPTAYWRLLGPLFGRTIGGS